MAMQSMLPPDPHGPYSVSEMIRLIADNSQTTQSDELVLALTYKESRFDPNAIKVKAMGLMQLNYDSLTDVRHRYPGKYDNVNLRDAAQAIELGTLFLDIKIGYAHGNLRDGLFKFGDGHPKYVPSILDARDLLIQNPSDPMGDLIKAIGKP